MDFNTALCEVLTAAPWLTCALAAIGLATVFAGLWAVVRPFFAYLGSTNLTIIISLGAILLVVGCSFWGHSLQGNTGACLWGGVSSAGLGGLCIGWQFIRHIIKWNYNELDGGL